MMIQKSFIYEVMDEIGELLKLHHQEINSGQSDVDPDWEGYATMEVMNRYVLFTARENEKLVGYSGFFMAPNMHSKKITLAVNDVLYVHPEARGVAGIRLIRHAEKVFDGKHIIYGATPDSPLNALLPKLGYRLEETKWGKQPKV